MVEKIGITVWKGSGKIDINPRLEQKGVKIGGQTTVEKNEKTMGIQIENAHNQKELRPKFEITQKTGHIIKSDQKFGLKLEEGSKKLALKFIRKMVMKIWKWSGKKS